MNIVGKLKKYREEWEEVRQERYLFMNQTEHRRRCMMFAKAYESKKINPNMVVYESNWGRGIVDNPYAIFKELVGRKEYSHLQHIWAVESFENDWPSMRRYSDYPNVSFVKVGSQDYMEALTEAKYLISNSTFPNYFVKKPDQIYINTWHGTPLKNMGYDEPDGNSAAANTVRNFLCADYLLAANDIMTEMYLKSYKLQGILPGEIIEEGYPRNDLLVDTPRQQILNDLKAVGVQIDADKQIVMYAPTWRGDSPGKAVINPAELLEVKKYLEDNIDTERYQIIIKPHHFVYTYLKDMEEYKGLLVPSSIDTNELMSIVDIMVSDYSSIFLDFLATDRPVLFYIPDLAGYKATRGIHVQPEELPGPYTDNLADIAQYICDIEIVRKKYVDSYEFMKQKVCNYEDGKVSSRIIDVMFAGRDDYHKIKPENRKQKLLISGGALMENGLTHSFLSLLEQIDYENWDVTAIVTENTKDPSSRYKINHVNDNVRVLVKCGYNVITYEDEVKREFLTIRGLYRGIFRKMYPWAAMKREFARCFGMAEFDYIVDFSGYSPILAPILLQGEAKKKSIWLHNDIKADMNRKVNGKKTIWKILHFNVSLYPFFDNLVSCSRSVMEVNRDNLSTSQTYDRFKYAKNTVNTLRVKNCLNAKPEITINNKEYLIKNQIDSNEDSRTLDLVEFPQKKYTNFVTMGRMSTEKNHISLIKAFAKLHQEYKDTRLYIIGEGPLRRKEEAAIKILGVEEDVILTGNISNPFAMMKRCDCFVMPSIHEGQPMVLLEARACGLPIIVSNFSTVKDSLYPDGQLVIETDEESIYEGLCAFMNGSVPVYPFDLDDYNREAYNEFMSAIH